VKRAAALLAALALAGCGDDAKQVPADAVAVVDGEEIARSDYDAVLAQAKKSYTTQKRPFPAAGSPELQTLKTQIVQTLVQQEQFEQQAEELDIAVTEQQVDARLAQIQKQYFGGDEKAYEKQLAEQGLTNAQVRKELRGQLISEQVFKQVTDDVKVTDAQIEEYYGKNEAQYSRPQSRDVRHILVKTKQQADELHEQLVGGADFAALARKHSEDPGSKANGGELTISRGQTVAPFDEAAFELKQDELSEPVKTDFGFHIIQARSAIKPASVSPLAEVKDSIRQQLLQVEKNEAMSKWVEELKDDYEDKVVYGPGFAPPPAVTTAPAATTTS
jgi:parvulin-like peptidyl-prolyl isomerase